MKIQNMNEIREIFQELSISQACLLDSVGEIHSEKLANELAEQVKQIRDLTEMLKAELDEE